MTPAVVCNLCSASVFDALLPRPACLQDSLSLTIRGTGFEKFIDYNTIGIRASNGSAVKGSLEKATRTQLIFGFHRLAQTNAGPLYMDIGNICCNCSAGVCNEPGGAWEAGVATCVPVNSTGEVQVATVVAADPSIVQNTDVLLSDAARLNITGRGFNPAVLNATYAAFAVARGDPVKAMTHKATLTQLVMTFTHLAPTNRGFLSATVTVSSTWSSSGTTVAQIVDTAPTTYSSTGLLNTDSLTLTVMGRGFDATRASNNNIELADHIGLLIQGDTASSTISSLVYSFRTISPSNQDVLRASVTVISTWSYGATAVATLTPVNPSIIRSTAELSSDTVTLTVFGRGFEAHSALYNEVRPRTHPA